MERQGDAARIWPHGGSSEGALAIQEAERVCKNWNNWYEDPRNWIPTSRPGDCKDINWSKCFLEDSGV